MNLDDFNDSKFSDLEKVRSLIMRNVEFVVVWRIYGWNDYIQNFSEKY